MNPQDTSAGSQALPHLALELKQHILRFCDPSTLAITSRVSLAFLELSSPILYQDIEIVGLKNVEKLFCSKKEERDQPHLHPHLSFKHVRNLTVVATTDVGGELYCSIARLLPSSSISLDLLTLRPIGIMDPRSYEAELRRWACIMRLLNPQRVHVLGKKNTSSNRGAHPRIPTFPTHWPRLRHLHLTNVLHVGHATLSTTSNQPFVLIFDLTAMWGKEQY